MESKYLKKFASLESSKLPLRGNRLLVEVLPKIEIKSQGGLIVQSAGNDHRSTTENNRAELAVVLAVGSGYVDDDGKDVPMDIEVGNVVLLSRMGLKLYSQFPGLQEYTSETIALTRDSEIHIAWNSLEHFDEYTKSLS